MSHTTAHNVELLGEFIKAIGLLNPTHNFEEAKLEKLREVAEALGCSNRRWRLNAGQEGRFVKQVGAHIAAIARVFWDQKFLCVDQLAHVATLLEYDAQNGLRKADGDAKENEGLREADGDEEENQKSGPNSCSWHTLDPGDQTPTEHCQNMSPNGCSVCGGTYDSSKHCGTDCIPKAT